MVFPVNLFILFFMVDQVHLVNKFVKPLGMEGKNES